MQIIINISIYNSPLQTKSTLCMSHKIFRSKFPLFCIFFVSLFYYLEIVSLVEQFHGQWMYRSQKSEGSIEPVKLMYTSC